jgi:hypothetical protein
LAGVSAQALVNGSAAADLSDQWIPTPAASGGSIFVVDNNGGVSVYRAADLAFQYGVMYADVNTGVTAGPVTDGTHIVLCGTSAITNYEVNNLSGNSREWTYVFGANKEIWSTPVISGSGTTNYVWVTVIDRIAEDAVTFRFSLNDNTTNGGVQQVVTHGEMVYGSSIIVEDDLWTVTYNPLVRKTTDSNASGVTSWPQFKFNKEKTGANTFAASMAGAAGATATVPGSSGGCFISTVR